MPTQATLSRNMGPVPRPKDALDIAVLSVVVRTEPCRGN